MKHEMKIASRAEPIGAELKNFVSMENQIEIEKTDPSISLSSPRIQCSNLKQEIRNPKETQIKSKMNEVSIDFIADNKFNENQIHNQNANENYNSEQAFIHSIMSNANLRRLSQANRKPTKPTKLISGTAIEMNDDVKAAIFKILCAELTTKVIDKKAKIKSLKRQVQSLQNELAHVKNPSQGVDGIEQDHPSDERDMLKIKKISSTEKYIPPEAPNKTKSIFETQAARPIRGVGCTSPQRTKLKSSPHPVAQPYSCSK